jgi:hypothetical protein
MPYSVLYMEPKEASGGRSEDEQEGPTEEFLRPLKYSGTSSLGPEPEDAEGKYALYYRAPPQQSQRSNPPRRHSSNLPQLFVSYGWGPMGK